MNRQKMPVCMGEMLVKKLEVLSTIYTLPAYPDVNLRRLRQLPILMFDWKNILHYNHRKSI